MPLVRARGIRVGSSLSPITLPAQMCELKYEKKIDPTTTDFTKLRVKALRKICDDEGIDTKGGERTSLLKSTGRHARLAPACVAGA